MESGDNLVEEEYYDPYENCQCDLCVWPYTTCDECDVEYYTSDGHACEKKEENAN